MMAGLQNTPHYREWSTMGTLRVTDDEIVPSTSSVTASYEVQAVDCKCSPVLTVNTSKWGDLVGPKVGGAWTAPDGIANQNDRDAVLEKMNNLSSAPSKTRCDVGGDVPSRTVVSDDLLRVIDAWNGLAYPYDGPGGCP